jgi:hypothetical protein
MILSRPISSIKPTRRPIRKINPLTPAWFRVPSAASKQIFGIVFEKTLGDPLDGVPTLGNPPVSGVF